MTEADINVRNDIHDYFEHHKRYPTQVEVTPELRQEMSQQEFYFHIFEDEEVPCVMSWSQPTTRDKRNFQEVTVPVVEVGDPVILGKPFCIEREHRFPLLAQQQARIAFQQQCREYIQQGLRMDNIQEEEMMIAYQPPTFVHRIYGFVYGDFDSLLEGWAS